MTQREPKLVTPEAERPDALSVAADALSRIQPAARMPRFRLLPITMMMAALLLMVKTTDLYHNSRELSRLLAGDAYAEEEAAQPEAAEAEEATAPDEAGEGAPAAADAEKGPQDVELASLNEKLPDEAKDEPQREFSQIELDILQSLAERRKELEDRNRELDLKEKLLEGTELRINDKLSEIKHLKTQVDGLLKEYSKHEDQKIDGLVKIYETMKPKDAAQIFNELDMPIMLLVVDRMGSRKVAPILAGMDPERARELTIELAEYRRLKALPQSVSADADAATASESVQ